MNLEILSVRGIQFRRDERARVIDHFASLVEDRDRIHVGGVRREIEESELTGCAGQPRYSWIPQSSDDASQGEIVEVSGLQERLGKVSREDATVALIQHYVGPKEHGTERVRDMIVDDIREAQRRDDKVRVQILLHCCTTF